MEKGVGIKVGKRLLANIKVVQSLKTAKNRVVQSLGAVKRQVVCVGKAAHYWIVKLVPKLRRSYVRRTLAWEAMEAGLSFKEYENRIYEELGRNRKFISVEEYCFSKWQF